MKTPPRSKLLRTEQAGAANCRARRLKRFRGVRRHRSRRNVRRPLLHRRHRQQQQPHLQQLQQQGRHHVIRRIQARRQRAPTPRRRRRAHLSRPHPAHRLRTRLATAPHAAAARHARDAPWQLCWQVCALHSSSVGAGGRRRRCSLRRRRRQPRSTPRATSGTAFAPAARVPTNASPLSASQPGVISFCTVVTRLLL